MSVQFNGTTEFATISKINRMNGARVWTTTFGVFLASAQLGLCVSKTNAGAAPFQYEIIITAAGEISVNFDNAGTFGNAITSALLTTSVSYHIGVVFNGGGTTDAERWRVYLDGVAQSLTFSGAASVEFLSTNDKAVHIACREGGTTFLPGFIDEIRMWELPLTPQDMANDMIMSVPAYPDRLRCWAPFLTNTDTRNFVAYDGTVALSTASADGGVLHTPTVNQGVSGSQEARRNVRRARGRRSQTQKTVPFYPGFQQGMF